MKKFVLFTFLLSITVSWSQNKVSSIEKDTSVFIAKLENKGITSYFTTDRTCDAQTPRIKAKKNCDAQTGYVARYVFWKESGVTKVKLIDNCGMFSSYSLKDASLVDYYLANVQAIKNNELKTYEKANNEKPVRRAGPNNCRRVFMFKNSAGAFVKKYNMFDLSNNASQKNINAESNNSLAIVKLDKIVDEAIAKMEANKAWSRM